MLNQYNHSIVIARQDIDNYLMAIANSIYGNRLLIDGTFIIRGLHIGRSTHNSSSSNFYNDEDKYWNVIQMKKYKLKKWSVRCKGNVEMLYDSDERINIFPVIKENHFCCSVCYNFKKHLTISMEYFSG